MQICHCACLFYLISFPNGWSAACSRSAVSRPVSGLALFCWASNEPPFKQKHALCAGRLDADGGFRCGKEQEIPRIPRCFLWPTPTSQMISFIHKSVGLQKRTGAEVFHMRYDLLNLLMKKKLLRLVWAIKMLTVLFEAFVFFLLLLIHLKWTIDHLIQAIYHKYF